MHGNEQPNPDIPRIDKRRLALVVLVSAVATIALLPFDAAIRSFAWANRPGGDLLRELESLQQYGALGSIVIVAALIGLLDRERFRRLLDLALAMGLTLLCVQALKMLFGRARPVISDRGEFYGPLQSVAPREGEPAVRAIELGTRHVEELWSMPSSHTAAAMALSVFLVCVYPKIRPLAVAMVIIVGVARIWLSAHWASDVVVGACVAFVVSEPLVRTWSGVRLLDWLWVRWVDRSAEPALPRMLAAERARA